MFGDDNGESESIGSRLKGLLIGRDTGPARENAEVIPFGESNEQDEDELSAALALSLELNGHVPPSEDA